MNRRNFIKTTALASGGFALFPYTSAQAHPLVAVIGKFAVSVGISVVASTIGSYLSRKAIAIDLKKAIEESKEDLSGSGYHIQGKMYSYVNHVFYAATKGETAKEGDLIAPFFHNTGEKQALMHYFKRNECIHLSAMAEDVKNYYQLNQEVARKVLLPTEIIDRNDLTNGMYDLTYANLEGGQVRIYCSSDLAKGIYTIKDTPSSAYTMRGRFHLPNFI